MNSEEFEFSKVLVVATNAYVTDCIVRGDVVIYIIKNRKVGDVVGYKGCVIKALARLLRKNLKVVEEAPDAVTFIQNFARLPCEVVQNGNGVLVKAQTEDLAKIIGTNGFYADIIRELCRKYYNVETVEFKEK